MPRVKPISRKNVSKAISTQQFDDYFGDEEFDYDFDVDIYDFAYDQDTSYQMGHFNEDWEDKSERRHFKNNSSKSKTKTKREYKELDFY